MVKSIMGIDIGTSNVKISIVSSERDLLYSHTKAFDANIVYDSEKHEQNPLLILSALYECCENIPKSLAKDIIKMGISGQMHGCMLWNNQLINHECIKMIPTSCVSSLYTWEDKRTQSLIEKLPNSLSSNQVYAGYGCATLYWLSTHQDLASSYDLAGTISDFFTWYICKLHKPCMSFHMATSWGYFDSITHKWNTDILNKINFPISFLPTPVAPGTLLGHLNVKLGYIPLNIPVYVAMGDLQTSIYACLLKSQKAMINMGTSAQVAFVMPSNFKPPYLERGLSKMLPENAIEYIPYFDGKYLASAPSLNGGNILAMFTNMVKDWLRFLGFALSEQEIWDKIDAQMAQILVEEDVSNTLVIKPTIFPERHAPYETASVGNIAPEHLTFEKTFVAICKGIVKNLVSMMPREILRENGITEIICMGKALTKNPVLQREIHKQYGVTVQCPNTIIDSSYGAALAVINNFKIDL